MLRSLQWSGAGRMPRQSVEVVRRSNPLGKQFYITSRVVWPRARPVLLQIKPCDSVLCMATCRLGSMQPMWASLRSQELLIELVGQVGTVLLRLSSLCRLRSDQKLLLALAAFLRHASQRLDTKQNFPQSDLPDRPLWSPSERPKIPTFVKHV